MTSNLNIILLFVAFVALVAVWFQSIKTQVIKHNHHRRASKAAPIRSHTPAGGVAAR